MKKTNIVLIGLGLCLICLFIAGSSQAAITRTNTGFGWTINLRTIDYTSNASNWIYDKDQT